MVIKSKRGVKIDVQQEMRVVIRNLIPRFEQPLSAQKVLTAPLVRIEVKNDYSFYVYYFFQAGNKLLRHTFQVFEPIFLN